MGISDAPSADPTEEWTPERLIQATYKDLGTPAQVEDRFYRHLVEFYEPDLHQLLQARHSTTRDYSITIDAFELLYSDPILGNLLLRYPTALLPICEAAVVKAQRAVLQQLQSCDDEATVNASKRYFVKGCREEGMGTTRLHARLVHLPPSCCQRSLARLEAEDVGKIWQIAGTVVRTSPVQMYESARTYECKAGKKGGCGKTFLVHADLQQRQNVLRPPDRCPLVEPNGTRCSGKTFKQLDGGSVHTDYQELKIQESASNSGESIPRALLVKVQDDLVDACQPGDQVIVVGSLLAQWQGTSEQLDVECHVGLALNAHSVRVMSDQSSSAWKQSSRGELDQFQKEFQSYWADRQAKPMAARDFICRAVCPKLYGMQVIKLSLLLTLTGGVSAESYSNDTVAEVQAVDDEGPEPFSILPDTKQTTNQHTHYYTQQQEPAEANAPKRRKEAAVQTRRRDQSHLLLVGDPGTGKSQFLRFAAALCPRSVLTTGVGTTSAGLTCAAVREGGKNEFALEAGALVLADKGVCCIDEFGCIQEKDRTTIHEAMEQQTLSVAKAGIVCKLNCRATIIAVMNPRNCLYDNHTSLSINTGLGTPLLSRFDLIFKLVDTSDADRDNKVTSYLLNRAIQGAGYAVNDEWAGDGEYEDPWAMEKLRAYIAVVQERFTPVMSDAAAMLLERHYEKCRSSVSITIPVTVRFLESLIRLSQAHARLMWRETVSLHDAVAVIQLMECSAFCYGGFEGMTDGTTDAMYIDPMTVDFSPEPDDDFLCFEYRLLEKYNMLNYLENEQKTRAAQLLSETAVGYSNVSWNQVEGGQHGGTQHDHYGREHFTPGKKHRP